MEKLWGLYHLLNNTRHVYSAKLSKSECRILRQSILINMTSISILHIFDLLPHQNSTLFVKDNSLSHLNRVVLANRGTTIAILPTNDLPFRIFYWKCMYADDDIDPNWASGGWDRGRNSSKCDICDSKIRDATNDTWISQGC